MDIHVSNLPFKLTEEELKALFAEFGKVESVNIIIDKRNKLKKGYGFVKMQNKEEALFAIQKLNGAVVMERALKVEQTLNKNAGSLSTSKGGKKFFKKKNKPSVSVLVFGDQKKKEPKERKKRRGAGRGTTY